MELKIKAFAVMAIILLMALIISGCSEEGCSSGCDNQKCDCVADSTTGSTIAGQTPTYHYKCTGSSDCGCSSCDSNAKKDGESCNPA